VLLLLGVFVGVVGATYNYLQTKGYFAWNFPTVNADIGREGLINASLVNSPVVNLRAGPSAETQDIGDVANGSRVKILNAKDNWYEVQILQRSVPKKRLNEADRGWVNKKYVDVQ
jgi:uncharacterized protein YgiM (DUF1202 family)